MPNVLLHLRQVGRLGHRLLFPELLARLLEVFEYFVEVDVDLEFGLLVLVLAVGSPHACTEEWFH